MEYSLTAVQYVGYGILQSEAKCHLFVDVHIIIALLKPANQFPKLILILNSDYLLHCRIQFRWRGMCKRGVAIALDGH